MSLRTLGQIYTRGPKGRVYGWMGWDGISKVSFKFLYTLWVYRTCIYLLIYMTLVRSFVRKKGLKCTVWRKLRKKIELVIPLKFDDFSWCKKKVDFWSIFCKISWDFVFHGYFLVLELFLINFGQSIPFEYWESGVYVVQWSILH